MAYEPFKNEVERLHWDGVFVSKRASVEALVEGGDGYMRI